MSLPPEMLDPLLQTTESLLNEPPDGGQAVALIWALKVLGNLGEGARRAVPLLRKAAAHPDEAACQAALTANRQIEGKT